MQFLRANTVTADRPDCRTGSLGKTLRESERFQPYRARPTPMTTCFARRLRMHFFDTSLGALTFDMSGSHKWAKPACDCPFDGRVRPLAGAMTEERFNHEATREFRPYRQTQEPGFLPTVSWRVRYSRLEPGCTPTSEK